jgi:hypothetical protein
MDKENVVYNMHSRILFSHKKNEIWPFATKWVELEHIILTEIHQSEEDTFCIFFLTCGYFKKVDGNVELWLLGIEKDEERELVEG